MGPSGGRPAIRRREWPARRCRFAWFGVFMEFGIWEEFEDGERDVDPLRTPLLRRAARSLHAPRLLAVPGWHRRAREFPSGDGYASLWRDEDVVFVRPRDLLVRDDERSGSRRRCCRPCASRRQSFGDFTTSGTKAADIVSRRRRRRCCASSHDAALQREPLAVRQGGARRGRLALAQARRPLQAPAGMAGPGRGGWLRDSIASRSR